MKTSTLMKIGITGTALSIVAGFVPIVAAFFGNENMNRWIHKYINETNMTVLLLFFAAILFYASLKKSDES